MMLPSQPRKQLTEGAAALPGAVDTAENDLIICEGDVLYNGNANRRYQVIKMLGCGTFGQVAQCICLETGEEAAVKVIKNQTAYFNQAVIEVHILKLLNQTYDPNDEAHIVRMIDQFVHAQHLCIVFERLHANLYEVLRCNSYQGLSPALVRVMTKQVLESMCVLRKASVIHCDLKPENILLVSPKSVDIKVIDFGSACFENKTVYSYIQSRFYRSPEVLLGHPYNGMVDIWSLGCVVAELFLGLPLLPGSSDYDMLKRIEEFIGLPPPAFLAQCKFADKLFVRAVNVNGGADYRLMTEAEYTARNRSRPQIGKQYFRHLKACDPSQPIRLDDVILHYPMDPALSFEGQQEERLKRYSLIDFLQGLLAVDPNARWTPWRALQHPFVTGEPFTGPFCPPPEPLEACPAPMTQPQRPLPSSAAATASVPHSPAYGFPASLPHNAYQVPGYAGPSLAAWSTPYGSCVAGPVAAPMLAASMTASVASTHAPFVSGSLMADAHMGRTAHLSAPGSAGGAPVSAAPVSAAALKDAWNLALMQKAGSVAGSLVSGAYLASLSNSLQHGHSVQGPSAFDAFAAVPASVANLFPLGSSVTQAQYAAAAGAGGAWRPHTHATPASDEPSTHWVNTPDGAFAPSTPVATAHSLAQPCNSFCTPSAVQSCRTAGAAAPQAPRAPLGSGGGAHGSCEYNEWDPFFGETSEDMAMAAGDSSEVSPAAAAAARGGDGSAGAAARSAAAWGAPGAPAEAAPAAPAFSAAGAAPADANAHAVLASFGLAPGWVADTVHGAGLPGQEAPPLDTSAAHGTAAGAWQGFSAAPALHTTSGGAMDKDVPGVAPLSGQAALDNNKLRLGIAAARVGAACWPAAVVDRQN